MHVPSQALDDLKCSKCNNYLSIFPIHCDKVTKRELCGRCVENLHYNVRRLITYEKLSAHCQFPCSFKNDGCIECLTPEKLKNHENICQYRVVSCSNSTQCDGPKCEWKDSILRLKQHYADKHGLLIMKQKDNLTLFDCTSFVHTYDSDIFVVTSERYKSKLNWKITYYGTDYYDYTLTLNVPDKEKYTFKYAFNPRNISAIFKSFAVSPKDACIISISKRQEPKVAKPIQLLKTPTPSLDSKLLKSLECPVCLLYMRPPIAQCNQGHSFCNPCMEKVRKCPLCQAVIFQRIRNFALESVCSSVQYPCKNREYDCKAVLMLNDIDSHEKCCEHNPVTCMIPTCSWKHNSGKLQEHMKQQHHEKIVNTDLLTYDSLTGVTTDYYLYSYNDIIFKVNFEFDGVFFKWNLERRGEHDCNMYMLEISIGGGNFGEKVAVRRLCCCKGSLIYFRSDFLRHLIVDNKLHYNFCVTKTQLPVLSG